MKTYVKEKTIVDMDVKMSMEQAHQKWVTRILVFGFLGLSAMALGTCSYNEHIDKSTEVQKAQADAQKAQAESLAEVQKAQADAQKAQAESLKAMWDHQKSP
jgi:hypothetical protein